MTTFGPSWFFLASVKNPDQRALNYILQIFVYIIVQNKIINTCSWEILGHLRDLGWEAIMQTLSIERHLTDTWHWLQHAPEIDYILFYIFYMIYRFFYIIQHLIQTLSAISLIPGLLNIDCILHYSCHSQVSSILFLLRAPFNSKESCVLFPCVQLTLTHS